MTNALQATPPGGRVAVRVRRLGAAVVLSVMDTAGPGAGTAIRAALAGNSPKTELCAVAALECWLETVGATRRFFAPSTCAAS